MARILITSALPYINGVKHLGNLAGSMLPADVYARFQRLRGHDVLYICATDEHGTPAELAAAAAGMDVQSYCDLMHEKQKEAGEAFHLSYDFFGRSSSPENHALTQHFAEVLEQEGLIEEREDEMVYSPTDGRFLPDRYVEGTCPNCGFEKARGDQCDSCGKLLDPVDLKDPYSALSGATDLEVRKTRHLHLKQSQMSDRLRTWVDKAEGWPNLATSIAYKWLDEGLQDRSITRDLKWGIPVIKNGKPREGFEDKVFYVWFDAPIEYIAATQNWAGETGGDWESWWRTDKGADDVTYVQFMGKDNVAFHTLSFPTTIIGSGEPWKLVDQLKAFNWVTWYGGKFSTSNNRGVFMDQALDLLPGDYWRYYLMANAPEGSDAAFTWEQFQAVVNSDLNDKLGNFISRVTKFNRSKLDENVPDGGEPGEEEQRLAEELHEKLGALVGFYDDKEFRKAVSVTRDIWQLGNEYLTRTAPWTAFKEERFDDAKVGIRTGLNLSVLFAIIAQPLIPKTAGEVLDTLGVPEKNRKMTFGDSLSDTKALLDALPRGMATPVPDNLFSKISDDQVAEWTERFGGADAPSHEG